MSATTSIFKSNLLAEDENTKMLQMLQALCEHHKLKIASDPEIMREGTGLTRQLAAAHRLIRNSNWRAYDQTGFLWKMVVASKRVFYGKWSLPRAK